METDFLKHCETAEKYRVKLSYPKVHVTEPNAEYAKVLLGDYAGHVSEFGAIAQYIFHMIVLEEDYPDVSEALLGIAIVEMDHLDMLGDLINELGTPPQFRSCEDRRSTYWCATPRNVDYSVTVRKALLSDISIEMKAIANYEKSIEQIDNEEIRCLIRRIILDEEMHIEVFSGLYKKYS